MIINNLFIFTLIGTLAGIFLFIRGFTWMKQKHLIENIPTSKIRSLAMGLIEIFGEAVPVKTKILVSPFSNKDCVYYRFTIEEYRRSGKRSRWVVIRSGEERTLFYLKDDTGSVLVDPQNATIDIPVDFQFQSGLGKDPSSGIKQFLKKNNLSFEGFLGINKSMRYTEYFIAPKDKVFIMGTACDNPLVAESSGNKNAEDIIIKKGDNEKFYYISDKTEKEILSKMKWKVIGGIYGGGILFVACLAVMLKYLGLF